MYNWTPDLAYAVGLITTDGCLSKDGRHIDLTSKDLEQIENFKRILNLKNKVGLKYSKSSGKRRYYYRIQFGNVEFYKFLLSLGLSQRKSLIMKTLEIPDTYFADFLRGCLDGDGCTFSYFSKQWTKSFVVYTSFASGSLEFLQWLRFTITRLYKAEGAIGKKERGGFQLRYAKKASLILFEKMYYSDNVSCLSRKRSKIRQSLGIIDKISRGGEMVNTLV